MDAKSLSQAVVAGMEDRKAEDIVIMDLKQSKGAICDYFVICSGTSDTHLSSIAESVEKKVSEVYKEAPWMKEGYTNKEWILLDYVSVVVHIFKKDKRELYGLEDLWGDAQHVTINQGA